MKFHQLSTFVAVVDHGSVTAAADALSVSQPAVSQTIRSLERDLGVAVFDRIGRNVRLNAAGEALLPGARQALRDLQIARDAVASVSALRSGRLDLVSLPTLGVSPVAELIGEFHRRHPDISVRLVEPESAARIGSVVASGEAEIGFTELTSQGAVPFDPATGPDRLESVELDHQVYVVVYHRSVELDEVHAPDGAPVPLTELASLPLVTAIEGTSTRRLIDEAFAYVGVAPRIAVETELREVIAAVVAAGGGYSILPRVVAEAIGSPDGDIVIAQVAPPIRRRVGVSFRPGAMSPAGRAFLEVVEESKRRG